MSDAHQKVQKQIRTKSSTAVTHRKGNKTGCSEKEHSLLLLYISVVFELHAYSEHEFLLMRVYEHVKI